jgi:hypothetical protein
LKIGVGQNCCASSSGTCTTSCCGTPYCATSTGNCTAGYKDACASLPSIQAFVCCKSPTGTKDYGQQCTGNADCCLGNCVAGAGGKSYCCGDEGQGGANCTCIKDGQLKGTHTCCSGYSSGGYCFTKPGTFCSGNGDCGPGGQCALLNGESRQCCLEAGTQCSQPSDCCTGQASGTPLTCAAVVGGDTCVTSRDCLFGFGCVPGWTGSTCQQCQDDYDCSGNPGGSCETQWVNGNRSFLCCLGDNTTSLCQPNSGLPCCSNTAASCQGDLVGAQRCCDPVNAECSSNYGCCSDYELAYNYPNALIAGQQDRTFTICQPGSGTTAPHCGYCNPDDQPGSVKWTGSGNVITQVASDSACCSGSSDVDQAVGSSPVTGTCCSTATQGCHYPTSSLSTANGQPYCCGSAQDPAWKTGAPFATACVAPTGQSTEGTCCIVGPNPNFQCSSDSQCCTGYCDPISHLCYGSC